MDYEDRPVVDFSRYQRIARTRKDHRCSICPRTIPAGSVAHYSAVKVDGEFQAGYECELTPDYECSLTHPA